MVKKEYIWAGLAILIWSTVALISKVLLSSFNEYQLLCLSAFFAFAALLVFNLIKGKLKKIREYKIKDVFIMIATGLCGNFFYFVFYYGGTSLMPASTAFIVNYLWPIMSIVFACIILKEKLTVKKAASFAISLLGVVIISGDSIVKLNTDMIIGTVLCLFGAAFYGAFTAFNKKFPYDLTVSMMFSFGASFVLSLAISLFIETSWEMDLLQLVGIAYNGIITMAVGSIVWALALNSGNTAKISNLAYITPFLSLIWVFAFLREPIAPAALLGLVVIILGIVIQVKEK